MSFKYSAISDNTPENREWLEKIGYRKYFLDREFEPLLHTWVGSDPINPPGFSSLPIDSVWNPNHPEYSQDMIDCRNNPQLFRAVTAMREDSDYMQWFVWDVDIFTRDYETLILEKGSFELSEEKDFIGIYDDYPKEVHKATLDELINHFKV